MNASSYPSPINKLVSFLQGLPVVQQYGLLGLATTCVVVSAYLFFKKPKTFFGIVNDPKKYQKCKLKLKIPVSHDTFIFRFDIGNMPLGLPTGLHLTLQAECNVDGKTETVHRQYTPISQEDDVGSFDLIVKVYPEAFNRAGERFPPGKIGNHLHNMAIGDTINVRGPSGKFHYKKGMLKHIGMIAGGTGITPMLAIIRKILKDPSDTTQVSLIFANQTESAILMRKELDALATSRKNQFKVYYTLDKYSESWTGGKGFVNKEMIQQNLPPPGPSTKILLCGPPPMMRFMRGNLDALKYTREQQFLF